MAFVEGYPGEIATARLSLRRPVEADRELWVRLHRDPSLYRHAPWAILPSDGAASEQFDGVLAHWEEHGFGYHVVERDGGPVGVGGLRTGRDGEANLYYRLSGDQHGQGYACEAARAWVAAGLERLPLTVTAVAKEHNLASVRTALGAGLGRAGTRVLADDPIDSGASVLFRASRVEVLREQGFTAARRRDVVDLWCRVTEAGGAVGFLPGDGREAHTAAVAAHEESMRAGLATCVLVRDPDAPGDPDPAIVGLGWWVREATPLKAHVRSAYRVMTDPEKRGRNLGRILMAAMHREARVDGAELVTLGVRGGLGLESFYAGCGYAEVGRVPGGIRVGRKPSGEWDDRDDVLMARRL